MGFFAFLKRRADRKTAKQIDTLLSALKEAPEEVISTTLVLVGSLRDGLKKRGVDLTDPYTVKVFHPSVEKDLVWYHEDSRKKGRLLAQMSAMVWILSMRTTTSNRLAPLGPEIWRNLQLRGRAGVSRAYANFIEAGGAPFDLEEAIATPQFHVR